MLVYLFWKNPLNDWQGNITEHNISQGGWSIKAEVTEVTCAGQVLYAGLLWLKASAVFSCLALVIKFPFDYKIKNMLLANHPLPN